MITGLIYDRTYEDVEHSIALHNKVATGTATASEITEWNTDALKGSYNYTDMNRVGTALNTIKTLSDGVGRNINYQYAVVTNYSRSSLPTQTDIAHLLANVQTAKNVYQEITAIVPSSIKTIENANIIEKLLSDISIIIDNTVVAYVYSGDVYAGGN